MKIELIIKILFAIGGWAWGAYQFIQKRRWQKKDKVSDRRYEAYKNFMKKLDAVNESMRMNPNLIFGEAGSLLKVLLGGDSDDIHSALEHFLQSQMDMVKEATKPLLIISQEINELTLIASDELLKKLSDMRVLVDDLNNEMTNCLSIVSAKDPESFKAMETFGYNKRLSEYEELYGEIVQLMRKELDVK